MAENYEELAKKRYGELANTYNRQVDQNTAQQIATAKSDAQNQLRQAYVQNIQNQRQLDQKLATAGIRGGATQTANLNLMNQYGTNRNSINSNLNSTINSANQTAQQNKNAYALENDSKQMEYVENREAEDRANAREDEQINYERNTANLTAQYSKIYSVKKLKKALETATDPLEQQIINARIGYIRQHKKGY